MVKKLLLSLVCILGAQHFAAHSAYAVADLNVPVTGGYLDVEYYVGAGAKTAYLIVDFGGTGGQAYAFGYRFDGEKYAADALLALIGTGPASGPFAYHYTSYPSGLHFTTPMDPYGNIFTDAFGYKTEFDAPADQFVNTWFFWRQPSSPSIATWNYDANFGPSGLLFNSTNHEPTESLQNREVLGFYDDYYSPTFDPITVASVDYPTAGLPRIPTTVPEPSSICLTILGAVALTVVARKRFA